MRVALDTNLLVYAEGLAFLPEDSTKPDRIRALLDTLPPEDVILPVQVLGELYRVLVGKAKWAPSEARTAILGWSDLFPPLDTTASIMLAATDLAVDHQLSIWDAVVLAAAAEAECRLLLSEDMHEGFTWRGLTVVNPVAENPHPLMAALNAGHRPS